MARETRKTGIDIVGDVPWGTHFSAFYQTEQDLLDILPPYFKQGLESNEYCIWVTSSPLDSKMAELALEKITGEPGRYGTKSRPEILDFSQWYEKLGRFDAQKIMDGWIQKESQALEEGFEGLRLAVSPLWTESWDRKKNVEYEHVLNDVIGKHRMIAVCAYAVGKCETSDVLDVVSNHEFSLIRHWNDWAVIENMRRKQLEREAVNKEEKARTIIRAMSDLIFVCDENDRFSEYHISTKNPLYRPSEEFLGKKHNDLMPPQSYAPYDEASKKVRATGKNAKYEYGLDINGTERWFSVNLDLHQDGKSIVAVERDITEKKHTEDANRALEERLRQTQKMEALSMLAKNVTHKFNNILGEIEGNADLLHKKLSSSEHIQKYARRIIEAAEKGANLTLQLSRFARREENPTIPVDIHKKIDRVTKLLEDATKGKIKIIQRLNAVGNVIVGNPAKLENALLDLSIDMGDTGSNGDEITFTTEDVLLDEERCKDLGGECKPGRYLLLTISNSEYGIDKETAERIFEPFFGSEKTGSGPGHGLAGVYVSIREHKGYIYLDGSKGSAFKIYLPHTDVVEYQHKELPTSKKTGRGKRILFVDDEAAVREFASEILADLGYTTTCCQNGKEAVNHYLKHHNDIDAVILDLNMPEMNGHECLSRLREISFSVPVVFSSGDINDDNVQAALNEGANAFLQKPFRAEKIDEVLKTAINEKETDPHTAPGNKDVTATPIGRILVADDDKFFRKFVCEVLEEEDCTVVEYDPDTSGQQVLREKYDVAIIDIVLPGKNGFELREEIAKHSPETQFIIVTGFPDRKMLDKAIQQYAYSFLAKPIRADHIRYTVLGALQMKDMFKKSLEYDTLVGKEFFGLVGNSPFILELRKKIAAIGRLEIPVLIQGGSGTGKDVVANCIHRYSLRAEKPFIVVNCTSLAPNLIESELFGHVQGAFTGAMKSTIGLFESADEGTLFLDEIGELALDLQTKFLQVLDKGEFKRVGGTVTRKANIRLICATNQELEKMVADGRFRKDLYYRICGTQITLVPLRDRREDIPFLVHHFLGEKAPPVLPEAMEILKQQEWPGNVRELKMVSETLKGNCIKKAIDKKDIYKILESHSSPAVIENRTLTYSQFKKQVSNKNEAEYFRFLLSVAKGNISKAARLAGIHRRQVYEKLKTYGIEHDRTTINV
ncbi:MAG: sigma 54-interacting transcriptional regulator [Chitinispirillaceae bacterium]|nr:sigma 54-interacting transcriptional regulator [Chitinispirillaceae bacterium]